MFKSLQVLAIAIVLFTAAVGRGGPVDGAHNPPERVRVPASRKDTPGETEMTVRYRANERAVVIVKGDHDPVADLEVLVYEILPGGETGQVVARGHGSKDLLSAIWTPLRTGDFRIVIRNPAPMTQSNPYNACYVTFK